MKKGEKLLTFKDLVMIGSGHVIGAGIVSVIGSANDATGKSVWLAFLAACVMSYVRILPYIFFTSAVTVEGGKYGMVTKCLGSKYGALVSASSLLGWAARGTAVLALSGYLKRLFPALNPKAVAILLWAFFCLANLQGINVMSGIQKAASPILIVSLCVFALAGVFFITPDYLDFSSPDMFSKGSRGFLTAVMLLSYSCDGIASLSNYALVAEKPRSTLPKAMTAVALLTGIVYVSVAFSTGALVNPGEGGNAALLVAAKKIFPMPFYNVFIFTGPVFALLTTMNSGVPDSVFPVAARAKDGLLPSLFSKKNKNRVYYISVLLVFTIGCLPTITGVTIPQIASVTMILGAVSSGLVLAAAFNFPFVCKDEWKASKLYINKYLYFSIMFLCSVFEIFIIIQAIKEVTAPLMALSTIALIICFLYGIKSKKALN